MATFYYLTWVDTDTREHADIVMASRLRYDEEIDPEDGGPFDYSVDYSFDNALGVAT